MTSQLLTIREVANTLRVSRRTIWRRIGTKEIPALKMPGKHGFEYRIYQSDLDEYLEKMRLQTKSTITTQTDPGEIKP